MSAEPAVSVSSERRANLALSREGGVRSLRLKGQLVLDEAANIWTDVRLATANLRRGEAVRLDMSAVESIDGGTVALLVHIRGALTARGVRADFHGADPNTQTLIDLYQGRRVKRGARRKPQGILEQVGEGTMAIVGEVREMLGFLGGTVLATVGLLREPKTGNATDVLPLMERMGVNAIPIVVLINFLVGFVLAYQGATQLRQFGANIFVADLVALSVTREMGPLMTAIILCGRTGAAYAAELGSMKVGEEIDALRSMGFGPIRYLVLPRLLALVVVMPVLTLLADVVGLLGGLVVGVGSLDLTASAYLLETQRALTAWDVLSGVMKSVVFAIAIALISSQQGFATTGGAEGVGRRTTSSVVIILLAIILIDAGFTVFFHAFDL